jgi:biopolymer transport protein TolQ
MELSILELFLNASVVVKSVIILLLLASIISWMVIFERWLYINKVSQEFLAFESRFWSDSGLEALLAESQEEGHQTIGAEYLFQIGFLDYKRLKNENIDSETIMSSVQRNMRAALAKEQTLLEKHLPFLATVASVSPYIGLFGTVWGIMNSFQSIAISRNTSLAIVAPGIAEALFATALGLLAAIPAVIAYNKFNSDSQRYFARVDNFSKRFLSII